MGESKKRSEASTERRNWDKIFNGLTQILQTQQRQLQTLVKERKLLEDRVIMKHHRWVSDVRLYEDHISQMKDELLLQDMEFSLEASKSDFTSGMKHAEALLCQLKIELSESELEDFKSLFDLVSHKCSDPSKNSTKTAEVNGGRESDLKYDRNSGEDRLSNAWEGEVRRLWCEYGKLASKKRSKLTPLMAEKIFVWNQINVMGNHYKSKLSAANSELELAKQEIEKLLVTLEQLQSSSNEKDGIIATLENQVGKMEANSSKLKEEIHRLSQELEVQRKSTNASAIPVLSRCTGGTSLAGKNRNKDSHSGILKRRRDDVISDSGTPRLFSSNFKVPKTEESSTC